ncbi:uncharacterized protein LOC128669678 isoform X2 [Plodia interpunctella]|uniref:uncharacterized protein LOC128669678 isoform X2 n=1 Tax=Plodia interpunctella TaxID=58824 RepID=UPI00236814CC|nr:uncharacterized protein LOC128669678 isoform X2 [Plodia interpunctella]XP_053600665.1 uncharacterized protein LOC128669678 isoform X2 [Plodia interpunctella]XP_053600673.1 uncharacterized protein LOC128669678 isoform X2 [Plodia interpunctella]
MLYDLQPRRNLRCELRRTHSPPQVINTRIKDGAAVGPGGGSRYDGVTTCEEFEQGAHFNPYEVVDSMWKIFYVWANTTEIYPIVFSLPMKKKVDNFKLIIEAAEPYFEVEWQRATIFMMPRPGLMILFLYAGTPGAFRAIIKQDRVTNVKPNPLPLIKLADIRMKMVGRVIGMVCCEDLTAYAFVRMDEMPETEAECEKLANKIGFKGPDARSYLEINRIRKEL